MTNTAKITIGVALLTVGCARFTTTQTDASYTNDGKPLRTITTKATSSTLWDSKSALASFKATQTDKTQSATVGSLNQESSGTNTAATVRAIADLLNAIKTP